MEKKIKAWLEEQGYPLELRVAAEFQRQKIHATLANFYKDPTTGNSRQIDVIASRIASTEYFQAHFVVECKKSPRHPWVLLTSDNTRDGLSPLFGYGLTSEGARSALVDGGIDELLKLPWMKYPKSQGVGLIQALSNSDTDVAFKATAGAMAASIALRKELEVDKSTMIFIFPTVVFDNRLFKAFLDQCGEVEIEEIDEAKLIFPMHFGDDAGTCVYITTAKNLNAFVADAQGVVSKLESFVSPAAARRLDEAIRNRPITGSTW